MTDMTNSIPIPPRAAQQVAALLAQHQAAETALRGAVQLLAGALDVPDSWQLKVESHDGSMAFVAPAVAPEEA